jgi:hypothetical protein
MEETSRRVDDRWETGLLWKEDEANFPNSKPQAARRLHLMEKKMDKDPDSAEFYIKKFVEYEDKKYIRKLSTEEAAVVTPKACIFHTLLPIIRTSQGSQDSYSLELLKFLDPH